MGGQGPRTIPCRQYYHKAWREIEDLVSPEVRVEVRLDDAPARMLWAYPFELGDLAAGFAANQWCSLQEIPELLETDGRRFVFARHSAPSGDGGQSPATASPDTVVRAMGDFIEAPGLWHGTGCFHRAALFDPSSRSFVHTAEDIGRHNCIDRLRGWALRTDTPVAGLVLFVSARMTASLLEKCRQAGFRVVVSRSAVTTASLEAAQQHGLTLIGFARNARFTVFHDPLSWVPLPQENGHG